MAKEEMLQVWKLLEQKAGGLEAKEIASILEVHESRVLKLLYQGREEELISHAGNRWHARNSPIISEEEEQGEMEISQSILEIVRRAGNEGILRDDVAIAALEINVPLGKKPIMSTAKSLQSLKKKGLVISSGEAEKGRWWAVEFALSPEATAVEDGEETEVWLGQSLVIHREPVEFQTAAFIKALVGDDDWITYSLPMNAVVYIVRIVSDELMDKLSPRAAINRSFRMIKVECLDYSHGDFDILQESEPINTDGYIVVIDYL